MKYNDNKNIIIIMNYNYSIIVIVTDNYNNKKCKALDETTTCGNYKYLTNYK